MRFNSIASPSELALMTDVVEAFCLGEGIVSADERTEVAHQVMHHFMSGTTDPVELAKLLRRPSSAPPSHTNKLKQAHRSDDLQVEAAFMPRSENEVHC